MEVVDTLLGIMDGFDPFFDSTAAEETDDARKKALAEIVRAKDNGGGAKKGDAITAKLIEVIVPKMREAKPVSSAELTDLLLGVLQTYPDEVDKVMKRKILLGRLDRLVTETADQVRLRPAKKSEEWGSHDQVYTRSFDEWDVTLGYFPDYIRHRVIYGQTGTSPLINKTLAVSVRYHHTEHHLVPSNGTGTRPELIDFLKGAELDRLAKTYGITYELPPLGSSPRPTTHAAKGGYKVMVDTLENELKDSPYSAEKLMREVSSVVVFYDGPGISFHLIAEFPKGHPDIGQNLTLVFGADFFKLTKQQWDDFKKTPPVAIAALEPLKHQA
jgi:hypothetical protein